MLSTHTWIPVWWAQLVIKVYLFVQPNMHCTACVCVASFTPAILLTYYTLQRAQEVPMCAGLLHGCVYAYQCSAHNIQSMTMRLVNLTTRSTQCMQHDGQHLPLRSFNSGLPGFQGSHWACISPFPRPSVQQQSVARRCWQRYDGKPARKLCNSDWRPGRRHILPAVCGCNGQG
jgi:hypothetical protein